MAEVAEAVEQVVVAEVAEMTGAGPRLGSGLGQAVAVAAAAGSEMSRCTADQDGGGGDTSGEPLGRQTCCW